MADTDIAKTSTTNLSTTVQDFSVDPKQTDGISNQDESYWDFQDFPKYFGYYKRIPELKKAIDALGIYVVGKGYDCDSRTFVILDNIKGWGEDTFSSVVWNMIIMKKINGDAFAEIIRDDKGILVNLKPLDPSTMRVVVGRNGMITRYEIRSKANKSGKAVEKRPQDILHIVNDRVADEIHGTSVVEACLWAIDARNEAMADKRRMLHRSTIRVIEVDTDDTTKRDILKAQYSEAIKNGEVLIVPKGNVGFPDVAPLVHDSETWIKYLENFFYQTVGVPKIILGGSEEFTEASSKIALTTFDQVWHWEQTQFEADFWNQVGLRIKFNEPVSLINEMITDENKNTGQTGFQPNDVTIGSGKA